MIRLSLSAMVALFMVVFLLSIALVWFFSSLAERRREKKISQHVIRCRMCGFLYEKEAVRSACPRCGALNVHRTIDLL
ncbi:MAG: hypothetical protein ACFCU3_02300 [Verrucomicrobiales bacterium]